MVMNDTQLGGRIALMEPGTMTGAQKELYESTLKEAVPWAESSGFTAALPDGRVIGPFNVALQSPEIGAAFARLQSAEASRSTLSPRARQIVILTVGAIWQCDYERYAHKAVAQKAGLPQRAIDAVAGAAEPQGLADDELMAWQLTREIVEHHRVSQGLFEKAQAVFGNQGIVDLLFSGGMLYDGVLAVERL